MAVVHYMARVEENGRLALPEEAKEELRLQPGELVEVSFKAPTKSSEKPNNQVKRELHGFGALAHVPGFGSEEFAREKQAEIDWEDRPRS